MKRLAFCLGLLVCGSITAYGQWVASVLSTDPYFEPRAGGISSSGAAGYGISKVDVNPHALYWAAGQNSFVDLNPSDFLDSTATACVGDAQYGHGFGADSNGEHALMWHGTAQSVVDLHPGGHWVSSFIQGASANSQIGFGNLDDNSEEHALLWRGSASGVTDLTPSGAFKAIGYATSESSQVGIVRYNPFDDHATLWQGSAESAVDLNPAWARVSYARGVSGTMQGGFAGFQGGPNGIIYHATLWSGTADSAIDLDGSFVQSEIFSMTGGFEVGYGVVDTFPNRARATIWQGSADSAFDLQSLLPSSYIASSALGVTEEGDVLGIATDINGKYDVIRWTHVVPEPTSIVGLCLGAGILLRRRRR